MRSRLLIGLLVLTIAGSLQAQGPGSSIRYISDDTAITLRQDKSLDAPVSGLLSSGTRVELIETDSASGYARVRAGAGREGWVLSRYLSTEPSARERLAKVEAQLAEQRDATRVLSEENTRLRVLVKNPDAGASRSPAGGDDAGGILASSEKRPAEMVTLVTGAGLFIAGLLTGLLIMQLPRGGGRRGEGSRR